MRGLSLDDVAALMNEHLQDLDKLFDLYSDGVDGGLRVMAGAQFAIRLTRDAPGLVAHAIVLAADEPLSAVENVRKMSMPVQIELVKTILSLTFEEAGGAKNFFASLKNLAAGLMPPTEQTGLST